MTSLHYWRNESSGAIATAVTAYLTGDDNMTAEQISTLRDYLQQWIDWPGWRGAEKLAYLRRTVREIKTCEDINRWLEEAFEEGHDPL